MRIQVKCARPLKAASDSPLLRLAWIADRLHLGAPGHLAWLLYPDPHSTP